MAPVKHSVGAVLNHTFANISDPNEEVRQQCGETLAALVTAQNRELSRENFDTFVEGEIYAQLKKLIDDPNTENVLGGLTAIDSLVNVDYHESGGRKFTKLARFVTTCIGNSHTDVVTMRKAAHTLGRLVKMQEGTIDVEAVEFELTRALEWLQDPRSVEKRHIAVLVLSQLASGAPTTYFSHVPAFVEAIWIPLRDPNKSIREAAAVALNATLMLISERELAVQEKWYGAITAEANKGFQSANVDHIHASLLALGELLQVSGPFMHKRFKESCDRILKYREHRDKLLRRTVIQLLPKLAASHPESFVLNYRHTCINHLLSTLKKDSDRGPCFIALGELAIALRKSINPYLEPIMSMVKNGLSNRRGAQEAMQCVSMLSRAVGPALNQYMPELLALMFDTGISATLTNTLTELVTNIPDQLPVIQERLLNLLSNVLASKPYYHPGTPASFRKQKSNAGAPGMAGSQEASGKRTALALHTLGTFDFTSHILTEFVCDCVVGYLDHDQPIIRKEAALTCTKLLIRPGEKPATRGYAAAVIVEVLEKLLNVGIADTDPSIRKTVLSALDLRFDHFLAQPDNLRCLFIALNDEVFEIRELAIQILGRQTLRNPAYVLPSLRTTLIQLLTELEFSRDNVNKEESARLLCLLVRASHQLVQPYVEPILNALFPKLQDSNPRVASCVLAALGELVQVGQVNIAKHNHRLLPPIIDTLQDLSSANKRDVALRTLGQLVKSTGYVITPFEQYPHLLEILLNAIKTEQLPTIRREVLKVLGIIGAIDPYKYKLTQLKHTRVTGNVGSAHVSLAGDMQQQRDNDEDGEEPAAATTTHQLLRKDHDVMLDGLSPSSEDYYPTVAISKLLRILRDPSLRTHHYAVVSALVSNVFKYLGNRCLPFLTEIMPPLLESMSSCETGFRKFLFKQLGVLVSITKQHIREYLEVIFQLINEYWQAPYLVAIISLVLEISAALKDEFKTYLPDLLPQILDAVHVTQLTGGQEAADVTTKVLQALECFGTQLGDYIHMILPAIVKVLEGRTQFPVEVRVRAIRCLERLSAKLNFSDYASRIIHPLARVLDEANHEELRASVMDALCALVFQLGADYAIFIPMIRKVKNKQHISHARYEALEKKLLNHDALVLADGPLSSGKGGGQPQTGQQARGTGQGTGGGNGGDPARSGTAVGASVGSTGSTGSTESQGAASTSDVTAKKLKVREANLRKVWDTSNKSTQADWTEWLRKFSVELLRESPSPALRSCKNLAQVYHPLARELFNASFYSCWNELSDSAQDNLLQNLEIALVSVPAKILQTLLNLAEFMEHDDKPLPVDPPTLSELALKCNAYAKALRYKETEFRNAEGAPSSGIVASLISIYNELQQHEAAVGILEFAQKNHSIELNESWYEKLQRWKEALEIYDKKVDEDSQNMDAMLGKMRCQYALGRWETLSELSRNVWRSTQSSATRCRVAPLAAAAAWNLGEWAYMEELVSAIDTNQLNGAFFRAILAAHKDQASDVDIYVGMAREMLDTSLTALVAESYNRAYEEVVTIQQLAELEEVMEYKRCEPRDPRRAVIKQVWKRRLNGCQANVEVWQRLLSLRNLVSDSPEEDLDTWLKFSSLCRKSGRFGIASKILSNLMGADIDVEEPALDSTHPQVAYSYLKQLWETGDKEEALDRLHDFVEVLDDTADAELQARCSLKLGQWQLYLSEGGMQSQVIPEVLACFKAATRYSKCWYKAWHAWALTNFLMVSHLKSQGVPYGGLQDYIFPAIQGFFRSIAYAPPKGQILQDTLRLLNLWFNFGAHSTVRHLLEDGFNTISIDNWLQVIPQIIARIHTNVAPVREMIHDLLARIGEAHPQALLYSITVACKSQSTARRLAAERVMDTIRKHSPLLVEHAQLVAEELIRVAILWRERWYEGLEEASRQYYGEHNISGMLETLAPLHEELDRGPTTMQEVSFQQQFGRDLRDAWEFCKRYQHSGHLDELERAWELYCAVFRRINKQLPQLSHLELKHVSPKLEREALDLSTAVPGTYKADKNNVVTIRGVASTLPIIPSKQRPRKLSMYGSDGNTYHYLLKGHEDLRQDERVMQLFGLVNNLLDADTETSKRHLGIQRYSVCPLSPNSGLIGWVPEHDTLHALIRDYRESRKIILNIEHRLMMQMTADYDNLMLIHKVEVFEHALDCTNGMDLDRILWLKSRNSETWLERRTNYTRSLAVMSMVGYILGLGDRHPSNLMMDRATGNILHIDFGDCFEVAMYREKFPEKIPFRLTRMLINAMEVSGIEGNFRFTCENVMRVMRENKQSLMAVLEAFVYDPLLNWRLLTPSPELDGPEEVTPERSSLPGRSRRSTTGANDIEEIEMPEAFNKRAIQVVDRVSSKLSGRDFGEGENLGVPEQVQRLIEQATSHESLCQCYVGWCPFW